jgi:NitT/TauT family transport system substrate-binding protein
MICWVAHSTKDFRIILLAVFGLIAIHKQETHADTIRIIYGAISAANTPIWVAQEKGLFKKYGLESEVSHITTTQAIQALLAGDIQFTTASGQIVYSALAGGNGAYVAGLTNRFVFYLYGRPGLESAADLRGKTIASTQPEDPTTISVRLALRKERLDPEKDVKFTYLREVPAIFGALRQGVVDAAVLSPPISLQARDLGFKLVIDIAALKIPFVHTGIAAQRSYMKANPLVARNFMKALVEALKIGREQPTDTQAIIAKYTNISDPKLLEEAYKSFQPTWEKIPYVSREAVQSVLDASNNPKARAAKPDEFIDDSILKELDSTGFVEALYRK